METVNMIIDVAIITYLVSATLFLIRMARGPTLFDRVLAIDALSYDLTVFMALIALHTARPIIASPMILLSLWGFALDLYVLKVSTSLRGE